MQKKMENGPLVSIIIPVYNVAAYLQRCINSVIEQTYKNIEILLIDDGSTDESGRMCDEYALQDQRIKVIHKQNGGLSDARNYGIDNASGEYITFIDSDDYVDCLYIEVLYKLLLQYDADVVCIDWLKFKGQRCKECGVKQKIRIFSATQAIANMWYQKQIKNSACGKLYRKELFESIRYPVGWWYEDLATTYLLLFQAKRVVWSSEKLYFYYLREGSIMNSAFDVRKLHRIEISQEILQWTYDYCMELTDAAVARLFTSNLQVLREIPVEEKYRKELQEIQQNIRKYRKSVLMNSNVKLSNRVIALCSVVDVRLLKWLGKMYKRVFE